MSPKKLLACLTVVGILGAGGVAALFAVVLLFSSGLINISITWPGTETPLNSEALNLIQDAAVEALVAKSIGDEIMTSLLPSGTLILEDDFSDNRNEWFEYGPDDLGNEVAIRDGAYHLRNDPASQGDLWWFGWSEAQLLTDFDLYIQATQIGASGDNGMSVLFGMSDPGNFYEFAYSGDGFVMLGRYVEGEWEFIREWVTSAAIIRGNATNDVRLMIENGNLSASINGKQVMRRELPEYGGGFIGFGCFANNAPQAHCTFDNLEVREPADTAALLSNGLTFTAKSGLSAAPLLLPQIDLGMQEVADRILQARDELAAFTPPSELADYHRSVLDWATQLGTTAQNIASGDLSPKDARAAWNSLPAEPAPFSLNLTDQQSAAALENAQAKIDSAKTEALLALGQGDREAVRYLDAQLRAQNHLLSGVPWCNGDLQCLQTRQGLASAIQGASGYVAKVEDEPWRQGWLEAFLQEPEPSPLDGIYLASVQITCIGGDVVEHDRYLSRFTSNESFQFGVIGNKLYIGYVDQPLTIGPEGRAAGTWSENNEFGKAQADLNVQFTTAPGSDQVLVQGEQTFSFSETAEGGSSEMRCLHSFTAQKQGLGSPTTEETPTPEVPGPETPTPTVEPPTPTPSAPVQNFDGSYEGQGQISCPSAFYGGTVVAAFTLRGNQITDHETGATATVTWGSSGQASWTWTYNLGGSNIREEHSARFYVSGGETIVEGTVTASGFDPKGDCEGPYTGHRYAL
ncbi:MAG: hypothetical protein HYX86_03805 [Chloroflexi bacterium]|nr:hypothetical protein [Chloroflexota bacterium]